MDYKKFTKGFEESGLNQKQYASRVGISAPMVSYYLKKARENKTEPSQFSELEFTTSDNVSIRITTSQGIVIEIPV
jgi:predicted transcriptional regulator